MAQGFSYGIIHSETEIKHMETHFGDLYPGMKKGSFGGRCVGGIALGIKMQCMYRFQVYALYGHRRQ